jgi:WD40 repeat protein
MIISCTCCSTARNRSALALDGGRGAAVAKLRYSSDGTRLAIFDPDSAGAGGEEFTLWSIAAKRQERAMPGARAPSCVVFVGDRVLACGAKEQAVCVWDVESGNELTKSAGHCGAITSVAWARKGETMLSGDSMGQVCTWNAASGRLVGSIQIGHGTAPVGAGLCAVAPDGEHLVATDQARAFVRVLNEIPVRECTIRTREPVASVTSAFAARKPAAVLVGGYFVNEKATPIEVARVVYLIDLRTGDITRHFTVPHAPLGVALSEDAERVAVAYDADESEQENRHMMAVRVWDARTGKMLREIRCNSFFGEMPLGGVPLAFAPDRRFLAVGENGALVGLWNPETGKRLRTFGREPGWQVGALLIFPDQATVAIGMQQLETGQAKIQLRELASGQVCAEFGGHSGPVSSLALSADGKVLASGSCDTTVILWDLSGLAQLRSQRLSAHDAEALWAELGGQDARRAYRAIWRLAASPQEAVAMLADKVKPESASVPNASDITRLIQRLDDTSFAARQRALEDLRHVGEPAREALQKALIGQQSEETRGRIQRLLAELDSGRPLTEELRGLRAVEVLEHAGTPDARALLRSFAAGRKDRAMTHAAGIALGVLSGRQNNSRR